MLVRMDINASEYMNMCWGGAINTVRSMTYQQIQEVLEIFDVGPADECMDIVQLNDIFWFEPDYIAELLGFKDFEELEKYNKENEDI